MPNYNKWIGIGRITQGLELKEATNTKVLNFSLAINRKYRNSEGKTIEETDFIEISSFGKPAELINKHCKKGDALHIEGRLKLDRWENEQGNKGQRLKVVLDTFQFL